MFEKKVKDTDKKLDKGTKNKGKIAAKERAVPVSYTHLTLPTKLEV